LLLNSPQNHPAERAPDKALHMLATKLESKELILTRMRERTPKTEEVRTPVLYKVRGGSIGSHLHFFRRIARKIKF
jgi:hypothetical protein